jgi:hypothetical protein
VPAYARKLLKPREKVARGREIGPDEVRTAAVLVNQQAACTGDVSAHTPGEWVQRRAVRDDGGKVGLMHCRDPRHVQVAEPVAKSGSRTPRRFSPDSLIADDPDQEFEWTVCRN